MKEMTLKEIEIGKVITVANQEFIVLDKTEDSVLCLAKNFVYKNTQFDKSTNNYAKSEIREKLNSEYLKTLTDEIGEEAILETEIDLTTDDGLDDYGKVTDKVGLLTDVMYRKYTRIIEKYPVDSWWCLATAVSTPYRGCRTFVRCVYYYDNMLYYNNCILSFGVRPFCILKSDIVVSV